MNTNEHQAMFDEDAFDDIIKIFGAGNRGENEKRKDLPQKGTGTENQQIYTKLLSWMKKTWEKLNSELYEYEDMPFQSLKAEPLCFLRLPKAMSLNEVNTRELMAISGLIQKRADGCLIVRAAIPCETHNPLRESSPVPLVKLYITSYHAKLKPLFSFFIQHSLKVNFVGRIDAERHSFAVSDFFLSEDNALSHFASSSSVAEEDAQQPLLHLAIQHLLGRDNIEQDFFSRDYTALIEYKLIERFFADLYPLSIRKAISRNLAIATSSHSISEEKKHASVTLNFLVNVNWNDSRLSIPSVAEIRRRLDEKFYGLEPVKTQILELAATIRAGGSMPPWGILLVGPAGTGKTAISNFVAELFNRPVSQLDMNAITNRETLIGSSRIYNNGSYGSLIKLIYGKRTATQIVIINEIDKCDDGENGSCSDVVLSFVDHYGFVDSYVEDPIPTDNLFYIATANSTDGICKALLDRFYQINIPAYTYEEKRNILANYTIPQMLGEQGLTEENLAIEDDAISCLCAEYGCADPGVRSLQRYITRIIGNYHLVCAETGAAYKRYTSEDIRALLGPGCARKRSYLSGPGLTLTAYTHQGVTQPLMVEASACAGTGKLEVIGTSGDAMLAHCKTAYMCLKNCSDIDFNALDVTVVISAPVPDSPENITGLAVFAAIYTACTDSDIFESTAFVGGCDMHGNTYFDGLSLDPYLQEFAANGIDTVFVPFGTSQLVYSTGYKNINIVEAVNMQALLSLVKP